MQITRIETYSNRYICLVRVAAEDGSEGWGQTAPFNSDITAQVLHRQVAGLALGSDALDIESLIDSIEAREYKFFGSYLMRALAGLDTALWDLRGKLENKAVCELLGAASHAIPVYASSTRRENSAAEETAILQRWHDECGFRAFKVKIGNKFGAHPTGPSGRTDRLIPLPAERFAPEDFYLIADANGGYSDDDAIAMGRRLEEHDFRQFEEPCPFQRHEETRHVTEALKIDVSGGEQDYDLANWRRIINTREVDIIQPDICYMGGVCRTLRACRIAAEAGISVMPHSANLSLSSLFAMHLMSAMDNAGPFLEFGVTENPWCDNLYDPPLRVRNGQVELPDAAGWGVKIRKKWLADATRQVSQKRSRQSGARRVRNIGKSIMKQAAANLWKLRAKSLLDKRPGIYRGSNKSYQKFILFSDERSGSSMVIYTLAKHPEVVGYGEIFNSIRIGFRTGHHDDHSKSLLYLRDEMPIAFLERQIFGSYPDDIRAVGFKMFPGQLENKSFHRVWNWLDKNRDVKILFLTRRNLLARYASLLIAQKTGTYNIKSESARTDATIAIDRQDCLQEFQAKEKQTAAVLKRIENHNVCKFEYEEVIKNYGDAFDRMQLFLGVDPLPLRVTGIKKELRPLSQVITNYNELKDYFHDTKWEEYFQE